jgi:hypothetical protein
MKTTIELAREAGLYTHKEVQAELKAFEALVRADEREACAKLCDDLPAPNSCSGSESSLWDVATLECAAAIRNRGNT